MDGQREFRICLHMDDFFEDHRRKVGIFVHKNMKTVCDLKRHIRGIFGIKHFFLSCNDVYLPRVEDIRVIRPDDEVWVTLKETPLDEDQTEIIECQKSSKSKKNRKSVGLESKTCSESVGLENGYEDYNSYDNDKGNATSIKLEDDQKYDKKKKKGSKSENTKKVIQCENDTGKEKYEQYLYLGNNCEPVKLNRNHHEVDSSRFFNGNSVNYNIKTEPNGITDEHTDINNVFTQKNFVTNDNENQNIRYPSSKIINSVGFLLNKLKKSESDDTLNTVEPKRKRRRIRKRPSKTNQSQTTVEPDIKMEREFAPPNISSTPLLHVRFDMQNETADEPLPAEDDATEGIVRTIENKNVSECPIMRDKSPKVGDIISFKILKISEAYTPEVSSYITSQVLRYDSTNGLLGVKILHGKDELAKPQGKFHIEEEVEENGDTFQWDDLIEPRLIYP